MANYSPNDILSMVQPFVKNVPVAAVQYIAFDSAHADIWKAYPWRWTLGALTSIALVDGRQDYTIADSDFMRPITARITRTDLTPNQYQELTIVETLAPGLNSKTAWGNFRLISRDRQSGKFRLESAVQVPSGVTMQIDGSYQKAPTKIVAANFSSALLSPDYHIKPYVDGLLYWLYKFTNDSRAGGVTVDGRGARQYNGQLAVFMESLYEIASQEDAFDGDEFTYPTDALGSSLTGRVINIYGP